MVDKNKLDKKHKAIYMLFEGHSIKSVADTLSLPLITVCEYLIEYIDLHKEINFKETESIEFARKEVIHKRNIAKYFNQNCPLKNVISEDSYIMTVIKCNVIFYKLQGTDYKTLSLETGIDIKTIKEWCETYVEKKLTIYEQIIEDFKNGYSIGEIAVRLNKDYNTIAYYIRKYKKEAHSDIIKPKQKETSVSIKKYYEKAKNEVVLLNVFAGKTIEELSNEYKIKEDEIKKWIVEFKEKSVNTPSRIMQGKNNLKVVSLKDYITICFEDGTVEYFSIDEDPINDKYIKLSSNSDLGKVIMGKCMNIPFTYNCIDGKIKCLITDIKTSDDLKNRNFR